MNNLYNQLNPINQQLQNNQSTNIQSVMQEVRQSGLYAKELFFRKAKEMGVDPQSILSQLNIR